MPDRASGLDAVAAFGIPVVAEQIREAMRAFGGQGIGRRMLAVEAQGAGGGGPGLLIEPGQPPLEAAAQAGRELVLEYDPGIDDGLVPAGPGVARA